MKSNALLEKLDWVFTCPSWSLSNPDTKVLPQSNPISDHIPYVAQINSHIPKASSFRFENFWVEFPRFQDIVKLHWETTPLFANAARTLVGKFKQVQRGLKNGSKELSKISRNLHNCC
jgi:hypothetical protein